MNRELMAILMADVAEYSRLMGADEVATLEMLRAHHKELIYPKVATYNGRVVNRAGDSVLAQFPSVVDAVQCAVEVQHGMSERNADLEAERRIDWRIGINLGDVIVDGKDIYGDGVNVAARLESLAEPGGICISRSARDQVRDRMDIALEDLGDVEVKNIARPVRVFRVLRKGQTSTRPRFAIIKSWSTIAALMLAAVAAGGAVWWLDPWKVGEELAGGTPPTLSLPDKPSIAVLPFRNMSDDEGQQYFADGLAEDIIIDLSKLSGVFVIARHSSFRYKGRSADLKSIGQELGVRYVVEGSVRRTSDKVRITAQLIDTFSGGHVWAERYDRSFEDLFAIQDEVVSSIISELAVQITATEQTRVNKIPTQNLEAYDYYLRAEQGRLHMTVETVNDTIKFYEKAIALDTKFAHAYAGYAQTQVEALRLDLNAALAGASARKRAYSAASTALKFDPDNARSYIVLALLQLIEGQHGRAIDSAEKAIKLRAGDAELQFYYGLVLTYSGRLEDAVAAVEKALRLNPEASGTARLTAGIAYYANGRYDAAIRALEVARDTMLRNWTAREFLAAAYAYSGRTKAAEREVKELQKLLSMASLTYYRAIYTYYARKDDLDHHIEGLRRAGMPEWPFGLTPLAHNPLKDVALRAVTFGRSWKGNHAHTGISFIQENTKSGDFAYRSSNSFLTGKISVENDMLCQRADGYLAGQKLCGFVYANDASNGADDSYVFVNVESVRYFSVAR